MGSKIIIRDRVWAASRDYRPAKPGVPVMEMSQRHPIPAYQPLVHETGRPFYDEDDDLNYRVVDHLDPRQGWLLVDQVMRRYNTNHTYVLRLARMGYLDPAMEQGSPTKRYRIRDDQKIRDTVRDWKLKAGVIRPSGKSKKR